MIARPALFAVLALAASALTAVPDARAQCRLCEKPTTMPQTEGKDGPVDLQIDANLDFDRRIVMGGGDGSATLRPDGTHQVGGSVEAMSGRAMVGEARVHGEPGRAIRIDLPSRIELYSMEGSRISIDEIVTDLTAVPRLDSGGNLSFRIGGRVRLSGNSAGDFRGDFPITVEYP
jgi:Domain of unknown function (DUF4402)